MDYPQTAPAYQVLFSENGKWLHAPGSTFLFAYLKNDWSIDIVSKVTKAFENALAMSTKIKDAVKTTSGQKVVNDLYVLNQTAMTKAMNSIDGMGLTAANQQSKKGSGTAVEINTQFFQTILGTLGGDVAPISEYLKTQMGKIQTQVSKEEISNKFGTVIGFISLMPVLNVPITSFQYVFTSKETKSFVVNTNCSSTEHYSFDYKFTVANYNYVKPSNV